MAPTKKLSGDPDKDPTDLSNAPFAFGGSSTSSENSSEYTLSNAPCQWQPPSKPPPSKQPGPATPCPFPTCRAQMAAQHRLQQMPYNYQPFSQQPAEYAPRNIPPVLAHLQEMRFGTRDNPRASTGDDFIPAPSQVSSPVNELAPSSIDELASIDDLAAARAGSPPPQAPKVPWQVVVATLRLLFISFEAWRVVQQEDLGRSLPVSQADEDADGDEVMGLVNSIHDVVNSESTPGPQAYEDAGGDEVTESANTTRDEVITWEGTPGPDAGEDAGGHESTHPANTADEEVDNSDSTSESSWVYLFNTRQVQLHPRVPVHKKEY